MILERQSWSISPFGTPCVLIEGRGYLSIVLTNVAKDFSKIKIFGVDRRTERYQRVSIHPFFLIQLDDKTVGILS